MALQDLTPELRTRLSRVERGVGLFVGLATLLLLAGFAYYVYHTAQRKGWFDTKVRYWTSLSSAAGLKVGDQVKLMGFEVGEVTKVIPNGPYDYFNVTVEFEIKRGRYDNYGYIWSDSRVKVMATDLLGNRFLEITKGIEGVPTIRPDEKGTDLQVLNQESLKSLIATNQAVWAAEALKRGQKTLPVVEGFKLLPEPAQAAFYSPLKKDSVYWLEPEESVALTERVERMANAAEAAMPVILGMTNQLFAALNNFMLLSSNLDQSILGMQPIVSNITTVSARLTGGPGSLGEMLLPTNVASQLEATFATARQTLTNLDGTLASARQTMAGAENTLATANQAMQGVNTTVTNTDARLELLVSNLNLTLVNLADITSNLNSQVQVNTNMLSEISSAIVSADQLMQGLKKHWLLRSAFKDKTNTPPPRPAEFKRGGSSR